MSPRNHLTLFEDQLTGRFLPLAWCRPVYDLRCGIHTLRQKVAAAYGRSIDRLYVRSFLAGVLHERTGLPVNALPNAGNVLLVGSRVVADSTLPRCLPLDGPEALYLDDDGHVVAARLTTQRLRTLDVHRLEEALDPVAAPLRDVDRHHFDGTLLAWMWDLVHQNASQLVADAEGYALGTHAGVIGAGAHLVHPERIFIGAGAQIAPGAVLDASDGPIVVAEEAMVMANAVVVGPAAIGPGARVKIGAKLYEGTSLGPVCKAGGEVEETIFQGYSNKQHDGFIGHSYIGEWCNLGANTTNSDLKNNYSPVRVWTAGEMRDTEETFVGIFVADHTKTGIGTLLNTGTVIGVACNLYGAELPPKFVPSFAWGRGKELVEHHLPKALQTAKRVMARRDVPLTTAESDLLTYVFATTARRRRDYGVMDDRT